MMLAMFLASLDQTIVATSLSTMAQDLNGWALMSWVVSAYLVASTVTPPIYGRLSDLYGRCPIELIVARAIQGIGGGGLRSVSQATVGDAFEAQLRREAENFAACAATDDFVEGVHAFLEKRRPNFTGQGRGG